MCTYIAEEKENAKATVQKETSVKCALWKKNPMLFSLWISSEGSFGFHCLTTDNIQWKEKSFSLWCLCVKNAMIYSLLVCWYELSVRERERKERIIGAKITHIWWLLYLPEREKEKNINREGKFYPRLFLICRYVQVRY